MTDIQPLARRHRTQRIELVSALIFALLLGALCLPQAGADDQNKSVAEELKQKAQNAYVERRYAEAAALDSEIAENYPDSEARRYAVQILGNIYEENLVDLKQTIRWDREFLEKYADSRQVPSYTEKLAFLEKLLPQEAAFKAYQAIRSSNDDDDKALVTKYETLLKEQPAFLLKDNIEIELGYAYGRMDERHKSYLAFQSIVSQEGENKLPMKDRAVYEAARRYWQMTWTGAWLAWFVVVVLWAVVLFMKPWKLLTWASSRKFMLWPVLWVLLTAAIMPIYSSLETGGYSMPIPQTTVFILSGLNISILIWLLLLSKGEFWLTRPRALRFFIPALTILMTAAVYYLVVVYHPYGPYITDVFAVKLAYWKGQLMKYGVRHMIMSHMLI